MKHLINPSALPTTLKSWNFKVTESLDVDALRQNPQEKTKFVIKSKGTTSISRWVILGDESGAIEFETKEQAVANLDAINQWKSEVA